MEEKTVFMFCPYCNRKMVMNWNCPHCGKKIGFDYIEKNRKLYRTNPHKINENGEDEK